MKKTKILSSAFVMTMVSFGAFGADTKITEASICTVDVLGVSDNNATANAIATWSLNEYTLNPGQYLNVTETSVDKTTCPAGSYCVGGTGFTVDNAQTSIAQCPTGYPNSANGASADTQCYTACTLETANIAHAKAVAGNDYYGTGVDTCGATACETGYHVDGGGLELVEKTPLVPISMTGYGAGYRSVSADGTSDSDGAVDAIPADSVTAPNTWATAYSEGTVYGKASCQPKADAGNEYIFNNLEALMSGSMTMEEIRADLVELVGESRADAYMGYLEVALAGGEGMSEEEQITALKKYFAVDIATDGNYTTDSSGQYCYCQMDGFTPTGGTKEIVTSAPWVFFVGFGSADDCASNCTGACAAGLWYFAVSNLAFRAAVVGSLDLVESGGICAANTINIDWNPDNNGAHIKNMCTYDGSITVPADPVKPGYTFTGWKLVE